jgi:hypothetical protein
MFSELRQRIAGGRALGATEKGHGGGYCISDLIKSKSNDLKKVTIYSAKFQGGRRSTKTIVVVAIHEVISWVSNRSGREWVSAWGKTGPSRG